MSQATNVEIVREGFMATARGDPAAARPYLASSIEWDMAGVVGWTEKRVYRGEEVEPFLQAWADSWGGTWHFDVDEVRDAGRDRVFVAIHEWGTGVDSGATVDQRRYFAVTLRDGRFARVEMFSERGDALETLGLRD
jgi:ketosteroid isomerase-like protein